jgi:hypothetical protein
MSKPRDGTAGTQSALELVIFDKVKVLFSNKKIDQANFLSLLLKSMELAETYPNLSGIDKKNIVKNVSRHLLQEIEIEGTFSDVKNFILDNETAIDSYIDTLVSVSKGFFKLNKFNFKKTFSKWFSCFKCCK